MQLYIGSTNDFHKKVTNNSIASTLRENFFNHFHFYPSDNEVISWENSLRELSDIFQNANLNDHGILL
jgi:hypothetical protein